mmetsp:Transcript_26010/g.72550  ORF Transcript_26010/g.72550 Transcript_26010/m.72550 type:complete len:204 (+) Transcript_26010:2239-2850(+)
MRLMIEMKPKRTIAIHCRGISRDRSRHGEYRDNFDHSQFRPPIATETIRRPPILVSCSSFAHSHCVFVDARRNPTTFLRCTAYHRGQSRQVGEFPSFHREHLRCNPCSNHYPLVSVYFESKHGICHSCHRRHCWRSLLKMLLHVMKILGDIWYHRYRDGRPRRMKHLSYDLAGFRSVMRQYDQPRFSFHYYCHRHWRCFCSCP